MLRMFERILITVVFGLCTAFTASAGPVMLTLDQLDQVTAGHSLINIRINADGVAKEVTVDADDVNAGIIHITADGTVQDIKVDADAFGGDMNAAISAAVSAAVGSNVGLRLGPSGAVQISVTQP